MFFNHDDDPAVLSRDAAAEAALRVRDIAVHHTKDAVIFEREEVLAASATPFSVFTPYKNAWLKKWSPYYLPAYPVDACADRQQRTGCVVGRDYPAPIVEHAVQRTRALDLLKCAASAP